MEESVNADKKGNTKKVANKTYLLYGIIFILLIFLSFSLDSQITRGISSLRSPVFDFFMMIFTYGSTLAIVAIPSIIIFLKDRKMLLKYWFSAALVAFTLVLIKMIFHRERPFQALDLALPASLIQTSYSLWDFSFPSNHVAISFSALPFLKGKFFLIWMILAILVVFSRLYFGLHYLSDVLMGAFLGYFIPILVLKYLK